ncbi:hypothetical protein [Cytobacillus purgationiresistens]|uniref:DIP1984 family protein n=1 Tax=Cytobacillus purgationiresistens TaxID=863449 RepID=A0ABU0AM62_9BACI|nr:hypothetical protein [Cytobacillus purgationiresistens]MDQ0272334.1 hypothetical protein [Cytobacillus purgationiresistens]
MPKISLAEAVKLKSVLSKRIHELEEEMDRLAFVEIEKGSKLPKQNRLFQDAEKDIEAIRKDFRLLDKLVYRANIDHEIQFNNESLAIVEAIELASQLRARARKFKEYGASQKEEFLYMIGESSSMIKLATFDPEDYRLRALEFDRNANRISNLINAKNYSIELDFERDKYF